ncbi:MAG: DNA polymerase III subunit delta [Acidobacteriota bacterium]|nr:DNA polymerase III subunit delta [Acidobacteriota bacterium]
MTRDASVPCWFFCGTDVFRSEEFIASIQAALYDGCPPDFPVERFYLDETSWPDILDSARTSPMLFSPGRVIVVRATEAGDKNQEKEGEKPAGKKGFVDLAPEDENLLSAYLASPPDRTVLVVIAPGESKRPRPLIKFFKSRPASQVRLTEFKPLRASELRKWVAERARREGKTFDADALDKFCELSSGDLRRMDSEIAKLAVYIGENKTISLKDVGEIVPWVITLGDFDIQDALEDGDFVKCLAVLDAYFSSTRATPEAILGKIGDFLGHVLRGKTLLAEGKTPKEIFTLLFPYIKETTGFFYRRKYEAFFSAVKSLGGKRLNALFQSLSEADLMVKRADIPPRVVLDAILYRYCRMRKRSEVRRSS